LINQPVIDEDIQRGIGRANLDRAQDSIPAAALPVDFVPHRLGRAIAGDQRANFVDALAGSQQEDNLGTLARRQRELRLHGPARIESGSRLAGQSGSGKSNGHGGVAIAPQKLRAVSRQAGVGSQHLQEREVFCEFWVIPVAGDEHPRGLVNAGRHVQLRVSPMHAEHPLDVVSHREHFRFARGIVHGHANEFHRIACGPGDLRPECKSILRVPKATLSAAMFDDIVRRQIAPGLWQRPENLAAALVADVEPFGGPITHRVVGPGREFELAAVLGPRISAARLGHQAAKSRIGDDV
jgi:hypothetical protein